jgi:hypothetical protein
MITSLSSFGSRSMSSVRMVYELPGLLLGLHRVE